MLRVLSMTVAALLAGTAIAEDAAPQVANPMEAIASCYTMTQVAPPSRPAQRAFFVLIDQTTLFDAGLKQSVLNAAVHNLQPATEFTVATFSAYVANHYTEIVLAGRLDVPLTQAERDNTSKTRLHALDQCQARQLEYARSLMEQNLQRAFGGASADIARSDILATVQDFAAHAIAAADARDKVLLMASDMLENSSITSFYAAGRLRLIDPAQEHARVQAHQLVPALAGVRVYVLGGGLIAPQPGNHTAAASYRDPRSMGALESFWSQYFQQGGAQLIEFGKPQLLRSVD